MNLHTLIMIIYGNETFRKVNKFFEEMVWVEAYENAGGSIP